MSDKVGSSANINFGSNTNMAGASVSVGDVVGRDKVTYTNHDFYDVRGLRDKNPYLGLKTFTYHERAKYAGRDQTIANVCATITAVGQQRTLYFITGASGSGKSSFAQAGLLPALESYYLAQNIQVLWTVTRPSSLPLAMLTDALHQLNIPVPLGTTLDPAAWLALLKHHAHPRQLYVVVLDQFEEAFTQSEAEQRTAFFELLTMLPPFAELPLHVLVTMRADYLPELFDNRSLYDIAKRGLDLWAMDELELQQAIQRPLTHLLEHVLDRPADDKRFEPALLDKLAQDTAQNATYLPLLQVALEDLWRRGSLTSGAYTNLTEPIRTWAEEVYTLVDYAHAKTIVRPPSDQRMIMDIFLELVNVGHDIDPRLNVRCRRSITELTANVPRRAELIEELVDAHLLSRSFETHAAAQIEFVDIIHESLLQNWRSLQDEISAKRALLQRRIRFKQALIEWETSESIAAPLLSGVRLAEAEALLKDADIETRSEAAREFIQQSIAARDQELRDKLIKAQELAATRKKIVQRTRQFAAGLGVLLLLAIAAVIFALDRQRSARAEAQRSARAEALANEQKQLAEQSQQTADAQRVAFAAQSELLAAPDLALLLAIEAMKRGYSPINDEALRTALTAVSWQSTSLSGHTASLTSLAVSPDSQRIVTTSEDGTARLWNIAGQPLATLATTSPISPINQVAFSPDGQRIVTASATGAVSLWDETGQLLMTFQGHDAGVNRIVFSPDGQYILTASDDQTAKLWNLSGHLVQTFSGHTDNVVDAVFSPDGQFILTASVDMTARLWSRSGELLHTYLHEAEVTRAMFHPDGARILTVDANAAYVWDVAGTYLFAPGEDEEDQFVVAAAFSPDGQTILTTSFDGTASLWDSEGKRITILRGHTGPIRYGTFSDDGQRIMTISDDMTCRIWSITGELQATLSHPAPVAAAVFAPDQQSVVTAALNSNAYLWKALPERSTLAEHTEAVTMAVFSPDNLRIATASADGTARLWYSGGQPLTTLTGHISPVNSVAFSPDGRYVVTASDDGTAKVWDGSGVLQATLAGKGEAIISAVFSPDGQRIVTASLDNTASVWDSTGRLLSTLVGHNDYLYSAVFSPDGQRILTASEDGTAILWDIDGTLRQRFESHREPVYSAVFSPDGQQILTASRDGTAILWDAEGRIIQTFIGHQHALVTAVFSPNGEYILTASYDNTARLWRQSGELVATLSGHTNWVISAVFSPDGQQVLTASQDGTARLWDLQGQPVAVLRGHINFLTSALFSADGRRVLTASQDGTARLHLVQPDDLLALAGCRVQRTLTEEEVQRFQLGTPRFNVLERQCPPRFSWER